MSVSIAALNHPAISEASEGVEFSYHQVASRWLKIRTHVLTRPSNPKEQAQWENLSSFLVECQDRYGVTTVIIEQTSIKRVDNVKF